MSIDERLNDYREAKRLLQEIINQRTGWLERCLNLE